MRSSLGVLIRADHQGPGLESQGDADRRPCDGADPDGGRQGARHRVLSSGRTSVRMRRKKTLDLTVDPPPDLAIEVDNKSDSRWRCPSTRGSASRRSGDTRPADEVRCGSIVWRAEGYEEVDRSLIAPDPDPGPRPGPLAGLRRVGRRVGDAMITPGSDYVVRSGSRQDASAEAQGLRIGFMEGRRVWRPSGSEWGLEGLGSRIGRWKRTRSMIAFCGKRSEPEGRRQGRGPTRPDS